MSAHIPFSRVFLASSLALALAACDGGGSTGTDAGGTGSDSGGGGDTDGGGGDAGAMGSDAGPDVAPLFRNPVDTPDLMLARRALQIMGAPAAMPASESCAECHGMTRQRIAYWRAMSDVAWGSCFADLEVTSDAAAQAIVDCVRGGTSDGAFAAEHMGVFSSAARLPWFEYVFRRAIGAGYEAELAEFIMDSGMPQDDATSLTQEEFDVVAEWFIRGAPMADEILPEDPRPTECTPGVSSAVAAHVARMATMGWAARNAEDGMLMYGCTAGADPTTCLTSYPLVGSTTIGADWDIVPGVTTRLLYTTTYASAYWTRSTADGRFVAHGAASGGAGGRFIDLQRDFAIPAAGRYDPSFFPDDSGFVFHTGSGAEVCEHSVLTAEPAMITFMEAGCQGNGEIGLYEHVGASIAGGDYWSVHGQFESDNGGQTTTTSDPASMFSGDSRTRFTLLGNSGTGFRTVGTASVSTPYEGDAVLSPSGELVITRVSGAGAAQLGYVLRRVDATRAGSTLSVEAPEIARYCVTGGKPDFSFDERWVTYHHYESSGRANIWLMDLATGETTRITDMGPNQYALFPHFRSDGWIYFLVRIGDSTPEYVVASDAALVLGTP